MRSTKEFTRRVFAYIKQVNRDKELPSAAVRVGLVIADHWNEESGEAHPSLQTIALESGLGEGTVRRMLPALVARGHLAVQVGSRGSGHPNRYWPLDESANRGAIESANGGAITEKPKAPFSGIKAPSGTKKAPTGALNTVEHTEHRARPARTAVADRESDNSNEPLAPVPRADARTEPHSANQPTPSRTETKIGAGPNGADAAADAMRRQAFAALRRAYPHKEVASTDATELFDRLLDEGVDPGMLIAGAAAFAKRCEGIDPVKIKLLCFWLRVRGWEDENRCLPSDAHGQARRSSRQ